MQCAGPLEANAVTCTYCGAKVDEAQALERVATEIVRDVSEGSSHHHRKSIPIHPRGNQDRRRKP